MIAGICSQTMTCEQVGAVSIGPAILPNQSVDLNFHQNTAKQNFSINLWRANGIKTVSHRKCDENTDSCRPYGMPRCQSAQDTLAKNPRTGLIRWMIIKRQLSYNLSSGSGEKKISENGLPYFRINKFIQYVKWLEVTERVAFEGKERIFRQIQKEKVTGLYRASLRLVTSHHHQDDFAIIRCTPGARWSVPTFFTFCFKMSWKLT